MSCWCLQIQNQKKKTGVIPPKKFVQRLKRDNEQFCSYMHQVQPLRTAVGRLALAQQLLCCTDTNSAV
jgi:hypothetical protein